MCCNTRQEWLWMQSLGSLLQQCENIKKKARREDMHRMEIMDSLDPIAVFPEEAPRMLVTQNDAVDSR